MSKYIAVLLLAAIAAFATESLTIQTPGDSRPAPKIVKKVQPVFPGEAREKGIQGKVTLRLTISEKGEPASIVVQQGDPILADAAISAVKQWRWEPYRVQGKGVAVESTLVVNFELRN